MPQDPDVFYVQAQARVTAKQERWGGDPERQSSERSELRVGRERSHQHAKADAPPAVRWRVVVAARAADVVPGAAESPAPQEAAPADLGILPIILLVVVMAFERTPGPLPDVARQIGAAVGAVALGRVRANRCRTAYVDVEGAQVSRWWLVTSRIDATVRSPRRLLPLCLAGQHHPESRPVSQPAAIGQRVSVGPTVPGGRLELSDYSHWARTPALNEDPELTYRHRTASHPVAGQRHLPLIV